MNSSFFTVKINHSQLHILDRNSQRIESDSNFLMSLYQAELDGLAIGRMLDFIAGRKVAHWALNSSDIFNPQLKVNRGYKGEPIFPAPLVGSISHNEAYACAAITGEDYLIGVDVDKVMDDESFLLTRHQFFDDIELKLIMEREPCKMATLCFSAKECVYKAFAVVVGEFIDFHDAKVISIDVANHLISLKYRNHLIVVNYYEYQDNVFTHLIYPRDIFCHS
jgi:4'-phosphopantetheinyl transferase EntD